MSDENNEPTIDFTGTVPELLEYIDYKDSSRKKKRLAKNESVRVNGKEITDLTLSLNFKNGDTILIGGRKEALVLYFY